AGDRGVPLGRRRGQLHPFRPRSYPDCSRTVDPGDPSARQRVDTHDGGAADVLRTPRGAVGGEHAIAVLEPISTACRKLARLRHERPEDLRYRGVMSMVNSGTGADSSAARITPENVHATIARHMLADGYDFVLDLAASRGSTLVDARTGTRYLDLFSFFASSA